MKNLLCICIGHRYSRELMTCMRISAIIYTYRIMYRRLSCQAIIFCKYSQLIFTSISLGFSRITAAEEIPTEKTIIIKPIR